MGTLTVTSTNGGAANTSQVAILGGGNLYVWSGVVSLDAPAATDYALGPIFNAMGLPTVGPQALACLDMGGATLSDGGVAPAGATLVCNIADNELTFRDANDGVVGAWVQSGAPLASLGLCVICIY